MENDLDKKYYRISDVSELLDLPASTLRFWEKEFPDCAPKRSRTGRRYYTPGDIENLKIIKYLVKTKGLKIESAKEQLRENKDNVFKRHEIVERLTCLRADLLTLLKALNIRK